MVDGSLLQRELQCFREREGEGEGVGERFNESPIMAGDGYNNLSLAVITSSGPLDICLCGC